MAYARDLASVELWAYSAQRSRRRRAERARWRRMRRIGLPLAVLVGASSTGVTMLAGPVKASAATRRSSRHHRRILRLHATGPDVTRIQRLLGVPVDGVFGRATLHAVERFQHAHGLLVDGQVGVNTWAALIAEDRGAAGETVLRFGSTGAAVATVQRRLGVAADGDFGPITRAAVEAFQRNHGLVVDGQVGPHTRAALEHVGRRHPPAVAKPSLGSRAVHTAERYLGVRYVWGGESPSGFDCSGLVQFVFGRLGVHIPRTSFDQYNAGRHISRGALRPGDLVFFDQRSHVGIYVGGGRFIHAPHTGTSVQLGTLAGWYSDHYSGATRIS